MSSPSSVFCQQHAYPRVMASAAASSSSRTRHSLRRHDFYGHHREKLSSSSLRRHHQNNSSSSSIVVSSSAQEQEQEQQPSSSESSDNSVLTRTAEEAIRNAATATASYTTTTTTKNKSSLSSQSWQIDFCSRPLKDDRGKKVWELLITDEDRTFEHAEFFPNNRINSVELSKALQKVVSKRTEETGEGPRRVKFFRSQMMTIITRACKECELEPLPSRRCQTMLNWLEERMETVYKKHPGYDPNSAPLMTFDAQAPKPLPDALRGESWAFVALPLVGVKEEMQSVAREKAFGDLLNIDPDLPDDTLIPGVVVYTARAAALSGWTKGLELSAITVDLESSSIVLETGVNESWNYAFFRRTKELREEAREWEGVKRQTKGLHFLAIQTDADSETTDGFWVLQDVKGAQF
ncbi:unnamed protein product [Bathycoccus prasinos]